MTRAETVRAIVRGIKPRKAFIIKEKMSASDWISYFKFKASLSDITYFSVPYKDNAIIKSLMKRFSQSDIQNLIDFIWDGTLNRADEEKGIYLLSSSFITSTYNGMKKWKNKKTEKVSERGWKCNDESKVCL